VCFQGDTIFLVFFGCVYFLRRSHCWLDTSWTCFANVAVVGSAGAVDEDTFVRSFEDVGKVYVSASFSWLLLIH